MNASSPAKKRPAPAKPAKKAAPTKKAAVAKKATAVKKAAPAKKPAAAKKVAAPAKKAVTVKKATPVKKAAPAKKAVTTKKPAAKKAAPPAKKPAPAKKAAASAKKPAAKKTPPPAKKPAPVRKRPAKSKSGAKRANMPFAVGEAVVYPPHGVGTVLEIEKSVIADMSLELLVIEFKREKLLVRIPLAKVESTSLRPLSKPSAASEAMEIMRRRAQSKRGMWSRRSQEYRTKLDSGDLLAISEVARDLFRPQRQSEQSYSERQLYEEAMDKLTQEFAAIHNAEESAMQKKLEANLRKAYPATADAS